jgi:lipoyl-dependent peroxiredoxin
MRYRASAVWEELPTHGKGAITTETKVLRDAPYFRRTRLDDHRGTEPEELIAAAHAGCFSIAFSDELRRARLSPERITTSATVTSEKLKEGWTVTGIMLDVVAKVPDANIANFIDAAVGAKKRCCISRLLNVNISMNAKLEK